MVSPEIPSTFDASETQTLSPDINVGYAKKANARAVKAGFKTQAQVVAESGGDLEELMASRKREVDQAAQLNLAFDTNPASTPTKEEVSTVDEKVESESNGGKKARPGSADSDS